MLQRASWTLFGMVALGWPAVGCVNQVAVPDPPAQTLTASPTAPGLDNTALPGTTPDGSGSRMQLPDRVIVNVGSPDVPDVACFSEGQPFRLHVNTRWGPLVSHNEIVYRWETADVDDEIIVGVEGQSIRVQLEPGEDILDVSLTLPLGQLKREVTITSFTFERWNESGQACFVWQEPNHRDRQFYLDPSERDDA